jgi:hypothetical protein
MIYVTFVDIPMFKEIVDNEALLMRDIRHTAITNAQELKPMKKGHLFFFKCQ